MTDMDYRVAEALHAVDAFDRRVQELRRLRDTESIATLTDDRIEEVASWPSHAYAEGVDEIRTSYGRRPATPLERRWGRSDLTTLAGKAIAYGTRNGCTYEESLKHVSAGPTRTTYGRDPAPGPPPARPVAPGWPDAATLRLRARALAIAQLYSCSFDEALKRAAAR